MIHQWKAIELQEQFMQKKLSAKQIVTHFLNRIQTYDHKTQAFLTTFPDRALKQAELLDAKRATGQVVGKLAGIPIAIKDNIHVRGELTTCASKFLTNFCAPFDSTVVRLLEQEDAIILGKTNLDEFAMGSSTENSAMQQTRNPWNLSCTPGGSSGGSAAAVAARLCPIALGSDTGGSIRQPASLCGIVGYKPTYGRVSRFGLVAFGSSLDQIGPFATNTEDVALIMEVLGQHCEKDSTSLSDPSEKYREKLGDAIADLKIGVPWNFLNQLAKEPREIFDHGIEKCRELGATIMDVDLDLLRYSVAIYYILATAEASTNLARFDGVRYGVRAPEAETLNEVYDLSKEQGFGAEVKRRILLGTFVLSSGYQDAYYKKAQKVRTMIIRQYQEAFKKCDLVAMPVSPFATFEIGSKKDPLDMYLEDLYTISVNLAGLPAVSVPNGYTLDQKPVGLQFIGPQRQDAFVLQAAHAFEKISEAHHQIPPEFAN